MNVKIRTIGLEELALVVDVLNHLPEFDSVFYHELISRKLMNVESILIISEFAGKPIACKIAYNRYYDGSIYSWLGGVLPPYRNQGIADQMLALLEVEAQKKLFLAIRMKTRNKHIKMLRFVLKRGFHIIDFHNKKDILEASIELKKELS